MSDMPRRWLKEELLIYRTRIVLKSQEKSDPQMVSASMVTPYPPGFPILLPGQLITRKVVNTLIKQGYEIHGYNRENGLLVFRESALSEKGNEEDTK